MGNINQGGKIAMVLVFVLVLMVSCTTVATLNITYRLPPRSDELKGKKLFLVIEDNRSVKDIIGSGAREDFKNFSGNPSFSLARHNEPGFRIGPYDVPSLFKEAMKRRLENSGAQVISDREVNRMGLIIVLQEVLLDLVDRKWVVNVGYEARLVRDGKILSKQTISGQAERLKLIGRGQADTVMGEIFTDMVNRLDVRRMFEQAGL